MIAAANFMGDAQILCFGAVIEVVRGLQAGANWQAAQGLLFQRVKTLMAFRHASGQEILFHLTFGDGSDRQFLSQYGRCNKNVEKAAGRLFDRFNEG